MKRTWIKNILTIFFLAVIVYAAGNLFLIWQEYRAAAALYNSAQVEFLEAPDMEDEFELDEPTWPTFDVNFDELRSVNRDVEAWIWMYDTVINYPVLHSDRNNDVYLHTTYDGTGNSAGSIFVDYRNAKGFTDTNTVIYGHNMKNGSMFACLKKFGNQEFYDAHPEFYIMTPEGNRRYEIVAAFQTDALSDIYDRNFSSEQARQAWFDKVLRRSAILSQAEASVDDSFITLSTCVSGNDYRARFVVIGRFAELEPVYSEKSRIWAEEELAQNNFNRMTQTEQAESENL